MKAETERTAKARYLVNVHPGKGIGNAIELIPAMRVLHTMGSVDLLARPDIVELFTGQSYLDRLVVKRSPDDWKDLAGQYAYVLHAPPPRIAMPESEMSMEQVRRLGYVGPSPRAELEVWQRRPDGLPDGYIVVASCGHEGKWRRKRWPHYAVLADQLRQSPLVFVGSLADSEPWMSVCGIDLCGRTPSLVRLAIVLKFARLFVGNDCGPAHLACAVGTHSFILFGPTSTVKNLPLSPFAHEVRSDWPCQACQGTPRWGQCRDPKCMTELSPEKVVVSIRSVGL